MNTPLLGRDTEQSPRTLRVMGQLQTIHNSLIRDGTLFQIGLQNYGLIGLLYTGSGAPADGLAYTGDYYLDLSGGTLYKKV